MDHADPSRRQAAVRCAARRGGLRGAACLRNSLSAVATARRTALTTTGPPQPPDIADTTMPFIPHTDDEVRQMLATIGVSDIDALFDEIPAELRTRALDAIPRGGAELEIGRRMSERAALDGRRLNFIGAGAYEHHIPSAIWAIVT